jgi:dCMP deaminase
MFDLKWDFRFLQLAETVASWSRDPSTKVGAVAVRDKRVLALGFNGLPAGVEDLSERLEDRKIKYAMTNHAETNLLTYAARDGVTLKGSTCYVTLHPCSNCVAQLINAGIKRIVIPVHDIPERWQESFDLSRQMMEEAEIQFDELGITKMGIEEFNQLLDEVDD